ncbi:MAG: hypothetical protein H5T41_09410 [Methanomassiliicoccales archaeon]|nr:hypothetical protein [Methanomassiliicoccales archaeon]
MDTSNILFTLISVGAVIASSWLAAHWTYKKQKELELRKLYERDKGALMELFNNLSIFENFLFELAKYLGKENAELARYLSDESLVR